MNANSRPGLDELLGAYALDAMSSPSSDSRWSNTSTTTGDARRELDELRDRGAPRACCRCSASRSPGTCGTTSSRRSTRARARPDRTAEVVALHGATATSRGPRGGAAAGAAPGGPVARGRGVGGDVLLAARHNTSRRAALPRSTARSSRTAASRQAMVGRAARSQRWYGRMTAAAISRSPTCRRSRRATCTSCG